MSCYLTLTPNWLGCHDPQCGDSTWDHECPTPACTVPGHRTGTADPEPASND